MDRNAEWIEARHELSEASKAVHYWDAMPTDLRARMGAGQYHEKRAEARRRLRQADKLCHNASAANRIAMRMEERA